MACMTSGASSVTLQSLYWRSSDNFSVPAESSRVNWCSPARGLEDEILESRSLEKGRSPSPAIWPGEAGGDQRTAEAIPTRRARARRPPFQGEVWSKWRTSCETLEAELFIGQMRLPCPLRGYGIQGSHLRVFLRDCTN